MATVNFTSAPFNAPTDGSSSCIPAMLVWRLYITDPAHLGDTLFIPDPSIATPSNTLKKYAMNVKFLVSSSPAGSGGGALDTLMIPSCTITAAAGVIFDDFDGVGTSNVIDQTPRYIQSCFAGATSVTLLSALTGDDVARFAVGRWIMVGGLALQHQGDTNFQRNEFKQITGVSGLVISFAGQPLRFGYASTWPFSGNPMGDGPAGIYFLPTNFDSTHTFNNIHALQTTLGGNFSNQPIRTLVYNNCTWNLGGGGSGASKTQTITMTGCTTGGFGEIDKWIETMIFDSCNLVGLQVQSCSPMDLIIRNGCTIANMGGTAFNCTISDSTIGTGGGNCATGPDGHGRGGVLTVTNSTINWARGTHGITERIWSKTVHVGGGLNLFTPTSGDHVDILEFQQSVVPGFQYLASLGNSEFRPWPIDPILNPKEPFCITDVYMANPANLFGGFYFQTDRTTAMPRPAFFNVPWGPGVGNTYYMYPFTEVHIDGSSTPMHGDAVALNVCPVLTDGPTTPPPGVTYRYAVFSQ